MCSRGKSNAHLQVGTKVSLKPIVIIQISDFEGEKGSFWQIVKKGEQIVAGESFHN